MMVVNTDDIVKNKEVIGNTPVYSTKEVFDILYEKLPKICEMGSDKVLDASKYVRLAKDYKYENYRLCSYRHILELGLSNSLTEYQKRFISRNGAVVAIFNTLNNRPVSLAFRSVSQKEFMDYSLVYSVYGLDLIRNDFRYGDYLIITEGQYDSDSLRRVYQDVVAVQTSNVSVMQSDILKSVTDRFIIAFDNDSAGINGFEKALLRLGDNVKKLPIYGNDKDVGYMEEVKDIEMEYQERFSFYKREIEEAKIGIGFSL